MFESFCFPWKRDNNPAREYSSKNKGLTPKRINKAARIPELADAPETNTFDTFKLIGNGITGILNVPEGAKSMIVQLWGAGGGGAGCKTLASPLVQAIGAGGGGGGYAEAYFEAPLESTYDYYVAEGGLRGVDGTGADAELSWFGIKDANFEVTAGGGQGGHAADATDLETGCLGGEGGEGGGPRSYIESSGSAGGSSYGTDDLRITFVGCGGAGAFASGTTEQLNIIRNFNSAEGVTGISYGGGGSGSAISGIPSLSVRGGNGSPGYLVVSFV